MDPRRVVIAFVILAGCGTSPEAHYQNARRLWRQGNLKEAMQEADAGFAAEPSWRFRIIKADILFARGDAAEVKRLLGSAQPPSDPEMLARMKFEQGWAENLTSNYSRAEALLREAAEIAKPVGQPLLDAMIEMRLGLVQAKQGKEDLAEPAFRHVIDVAAAHDDRYLEANATGNLGFLLLNTFRLEEAIYWFDKVGTLFQQLGSTNSYSITLGNLGSCYQRLGDFDQALAKYHDAEVSARQIDDWRHEQQWIGNSGEVLSDRGDLQGAAERFRQALTLVQSRDKDEKDSTSWWYYNLASISIDLGDLDAAEKYNREALRLRQAIEDHTDYYPRLNEARIAAGRRDPRAEALYRALIAEYHEGMDPVQMLEAQAGLAGLLAHEGQADRADAQFRNTLALLEAHRTALSKADYRMSYLASLIRFYDRYINFLVDQNQPERALEVAESSRARVLDDELESARPRTELRADRMRDLARSSHSVFLSYWLGKKRSFLWAITPDAIVLHELPSENKMTPLVNGYRSLIANLRDPLASENPAGQKLSDTLLVPVKANLAATARVVLVPDRSLHALNFETLPDPASPKKYLIESKTIEVVPSLDVLVERRDAPPAADSLLLIGDPDQVVEEFPKLPFAAVEIAQISKSFSTRKPTVLEGAQASPAAYRAVKPGQFGWIHFAAHAAPNQTSPLDSSLILSRGESSYQLSARDVMAVPLNAKLVTLSACRSAGAKTYSGEGQVGLSWAFLRAGARSVVAGLWDVTDRSTAAVMADFYDQLAQRVTPADALRHAKLTLLHGGQPYKKPFYWGPFQLYAGAI